MNIALKLEKVYAAKLDFLSYAGKVFPTLMQRNYLPRFYRNLRLSLGLFVLLGILFYVYFLGKADWHANGKH